MADEKSEVYADDQFMQLYEEACRLKREQKKLEDEFKRVSEKIKQWIADDDAVFDEKTNKKLAYITRTTRNSFDSTRFKKEHSDMWAQYVKTTNIETLKIELE